MKVLISGMFDLLHSGHIRQFRRIKDIHPSHKLIVNVAPDARTKEKKGEGRPVLSDRERVFIVRSIKYVNGVTCIQSCKGQSQANYEKSLINVVNPDIFLSGRKDEEVKKFCKEVGIKYEIILNVNSIDGMHTTDIINKIKLCT